MSTTTGNLSPLAVERVLAPVEPEPPEEEFEGTYDADQRGGKFSWSSCAALAVALLVATEIVSAFGTVSSAVLICLHIAFLLAAFVLVDRINYNYFVYLLDRYAEVEDMSILRDPEDLEAEWKVNRASYEKECLESGGTDDAEPLLPPWPTRYRRPEEFGRPLSLEEYGFHRDQLFWNADGTEVTRLQLLSRRFATRRLMTMAGLARVHRQTRELLRRLALYPFRLVGTLMLLSGLIAGGALSFVVHPDTSQTHYPGFGLLLLIWMYAFPAALLYKNNGNYLCSFLRALNAFLDAKDDKVYPRTVRYALFTVGLTLIALGILPPMGIAPFHVFLAFSGLAAAFIFSASPWIAEVEREYDRELELARNLWYCKKWNEDKARRAAPDLSPDGTLRLLKRENFSCDWEYYVNVMQASPNIREREHLWLGTHEDNPHKPIIIHRKGIQEHVYMCGSSGIAKTSLGIAPLCIQLIRHRNYTESGRDLGPHAGLVIIDLKGDKALIETMRLEAENAGRTFKFFTTDLTKTTYAYNPLTAKLNGTLDPGAVAENLLEALSLNHGEGYGRMFFTTEMRDLLQTLFYQKRTPPFQSLTDLAAVLEALPRSKNLENVKQLLNVVKSLARLNALNVTRDSHPEVFSNAIYMPEVVREKQIVYFWLPIALMPGTMRAIAKLALYDLYTTAAALQEENHQMYLAIDEFQQIVSSNLEPVLQQARSAHVGVILANQSPQNLQNQDVDLRPTIKTNTHLQQVFSANTKEDIEDAITLSGESLRYMKATAKSRTESKQSGTTTSQSHSSGVHSSDSYGTGTNASEGMSEGVTETLRPEIRSRFTVDDINRISADPTLSIVRVNRNAEYAQHKGQSQVIRMLFAMPKSEYDARSVAPWPALTPQTMQNTYRMDEPPAAPTEPARPAARKTTVRDAAKKAAPSSAPASTPPPAAEPSPTAPSSPTSEKAASAPETPPTAQTPPAAEPVNPPPVTVPRQTKARPLEGSDLDQALNDLSQQTQAPPAARRKRKRDSEHPA